MDFETNSIGEAWEECGVFACESPLSEQKPFGSLAISSETHGFASQPHD